MFCATCGKYILKESKFCSFCGSSNDLATLSIDFHDDKKPTLKLPKDSGAVAKNSDLKNSNNYIKIFRQLPQSKQNAFWLVLLLVSLAIQFGPKIMSNSGNSLSGIGGQSVTNQIPGLTMVTVPEVDPKCTEALTPATMWCSIAFTVTNNGSIANHLYGDIFALVDGRTFISTSSFGGITYISTDINPAQSQSGVVQFEVPIGSTISHVFISANAEAGLNGAKVAMNINMIASQ